MDGFLKLLANKLYEHYRDEISSLNIILPNRRARLFFSEALSKITDKPLWQPTYLSMDDMMEEVAGIKSTDQIRLVTELYKVYSRFHDESFDSFYFWGEMLLSDFDSVDKYMIDADMLFRNIQDIKSIESDLGFLSPEQKHVIERFWQSFSAGGAFSPEKEKFLTIWNSLTPVYHAYRENLSARSMAYTGMVYRTAAEKLKSGSHPSDSPQKYVVAGFNALSKCEKILLDYLAEHHTTHFFWDYDDYYLKNGQQEAGLFIRENLARYPHSMPLGSGTNNFELPKNITVVSSPSDSLQAKYAGEFIRELAAENGIAPGKETAIVLTDENLLMPVLHAIPDMVSDINVTMGYPLKLSLSYSFLERLLSLQSRKRSKGEKLLFYHSDVVGLLTHPYLADRIEDFSSETERKIRDSQMIFIDAEELGGNEIMCSVFRDAGDSWRSTADYLITILVSVASEENTDNGKDGASDQRLEFTGSVIENINKVVNSLEDCGIDISQKIFSSLLRRMLQRAMVPYEGEPLRGLQVMGILETRNLDFENVILLSANDDNFPGNRTAGNSFIPYFLRQGYGLPTPLHHEGVYAYYFYRLLQRAKNIHIVYSEKSDEKTTGEQSRYIYQLEYESGHKIERRRIGLNINIKPNEAVTVPKSGDTVEALLEFSADGKRIITPTAFYNYIQCPLKFYFHSVARIRPEKEVSEQIDAPMFGTILHSGMERLYTPAVGMADPAPYFAGLKNTPAVSDAVDKALRETFSGNSHPAEEFSGQMVMVRDIVEKYINKCVLPYDIANGGFTVDKLERWVEVPFTFGARDGGSRTIRLGGICDRTDKLPDGTSRIIDYKTGAAHLDFDGLESLFSPVYGENNPAALQTMIYALIVNRLTGRDVQPALYFVRQMNKTGYSSLLEDKSRGCPVCSYLDYKDDFEALFREKLSELFDENSPFVQCDDVKTCQWCDFRSICRR